MSTSRDDIVVIGLVLLAYKLWQDYQQGIVPALQQQGANLYEVLHPSQRAHADDLPEKQMTKQAIEAVARAVGFPDPHMAMAIAMQESGGFPRHINRGNPPGREDSHGLWQINVLAWPQFSGWQLSDPMQNARAAFKISKGGTDWMPWSAYKTGKYVKWL